MRRFQRLPPWVCVLLTGRPQVAEGFSRWSPVWIKPSATENQDDLRALLAWRLAKGGYVAEEHVAAAADVMLAKSEVRTCAIAACLPACAQASWSLLCAWTAPSNAVLAYRPWAMGHPGAGRLHMPCSTAQPCRPAAHKRHGAAAMQCDMTWL